MLVIRNEQLRVLNRKFEQAFRDTAAESLQIEYPELVRTLGPEGLSQFIDYGITRATAHGVQFERDYYDWLDAMAKLGQDFHQLEWAARILNDTSEPPVGRMSRLMGWVETMSQMRSQ